MVPSIIQSRQMSTMPSPATEVRDSSVNNNENPDNARQAFDGLKQSLKKSFKVARRFSTDKLKQRFPPSSYNSKNIDPPPTASASSFQPSTSTTANSPFSSSDPVLTATSLRRSAPTTSHAHQRAADHTAFVSSSAVTLPAPTRPVFALDIPMSNIQVDAEVPWVTRPHEEALRNRVDELVVQQIHPAFARMRAMEGQEDRGPFLVAQDVSSQLYEAFRHLANVPYFTFEYDHMSQTVWYFGDPSEVHECFNSSFPDLLKGKLMKILREAPLQPVPPEGATLGDHRSLALDLYRRMNFDETEDMDVGEEEEELGNEGGQGREEGLNSDRRPQNMNSGEDNAAEDEDEERDDDPEEKGLALKKMLFMFSNSPAKPIEIPDEQISKKKEPDFLVQTSEPFSRIYCSKSLVVLETAVWNETVSQLAEEVRVWKKNGSSVAIGFKINRRGPLNGFDPLIYLFVAYNVVEKANGVIVTLTRHLQYNLGRLSGVKAIKMLCTTGDSRDGLLRKRLDAIHNGGRQAGAYESVPGFTVISPTPPLIRIPLGSVLMEALDSQGYGHESPALLDYFRQQELVIDASVIRSEIISLCLAEEASQRRAASPGYADFIESQKLAGMSDAEAQRAWTLHLLELEDAQSAENAAARLARAREIADAENAAHRGPGGQQPAPAPARRTMITRLMHRLNPER